MTSATSLLTLGLLWFATPASVEETARFRLYDGPEGFTSGRSRIAKLSDGGFVVIWTYIDPARHKKGTQIKVRRFDSAGHPTGTPKTIARLTPADGQLSSPDIACAPSNQCLVVWGEVENQPDPPFVRPVPSEVVGYRFRADRLRRGKRFLIATEPSMNGVTVAHLGEDTGFAVAWSSWGREETFVRRYSDQGLPTGTTSTLGKQATYYLRSAANKKGDLMIAGLREATSETDDVAAVWTGGLGTGGTVLEPSIDCPVEEFPMGLAPAGSSGSFYAVWACDERQLKLARWSPGSTESSNIRTLDEESEPIDAISMAAAASKSQVFVAWSAYLPATDRALHLRLARFDHQSQPCGPTFSLGSWYLHDLAVLADGRLLTIVLEPREEYGPSPLYGVLWRLPDKPASCDSD